MVSRARIAPLARVRIARPRRNGARAARRTLFRSTDMRHASTYPRLTDKYRALRTSARSNRIHEVPGPEGEDCRGPEAQGFRQPVHVITMAKGPKQSDPNKRRGGGR